MLVHERPWRLTWGGRRSVRLRVRECPLRVDIVAELGEGQLASNNRIGMNKFLNQHCALAPFFESILLTRALKIVLQQYRSKADLGRFGTRIRATPSILTAKPAIQSMIEPVSAADLQKFGNISRNARRQLANFSGARPVLEFRDHRLTSESPATARFSRGWLTKTQRPDWLVGGLGFEPRLTESESAVLPLNYPPKHFVYSTLVRSSDSLASV